MNSRWFSLSLLALALSACPGAPTPTPQSQSNDITGTVRLNVSAQSTSSLPKLKFVPGEVIVKFKPGLRAQSVKALAVNGIQLQETRTLGLEGTHLYRANAGTLSADANSTLKLVQQLEARADVLWAQPNYYMQALATPNDTFFKAQWHSTAINLLQAWDLEKGSSNPVTVAVVDTGILTAHPEFQGKLLPGYDFISSPQNALDGNGRDNNPDDPGDAPGQQSSYHGSHVAGTIAAATNNGVGMAGVSWGAKILPVRVLGAQGGTLADITDSMLWSAGLSVPGAPNNPNPAQALNLSLGGDAVCEQVPIYQDVIDRVNAKGAIIVVAAGNENKDAAETSPASCSGVITVGASEFANQRARYSNYGPRVDVMAPGGDVKVDLNGDTYPDGVLSVGRNDETKELLFTFKNGTSMAAPHVAGVIALMKSRDPSVSFARVLDVLKRTARPLTATACTGQGPNLGAQDCGAGLIDAAAALQALGTGGDPNPPAQADFSLSLNPSSLTMAPNSSQNITISLVRTGGFSGQVSLATQGAPAGVSFELQNAGNTSAKLKINAGNVAKGSYAIQLIGTSGSISRNASLSLRIETNAPTRPSVQGTAVLACYYKNDDCDEARSRIVTVGNPGTSGAYSLRGLEDGKYLMIAWKDLNGDKDVNAGDALAIYTENADVALIQPPASRIDLELSPLLGTGANATSLVRQAHYTKLLQRWWVEHPQP